jgi:hypothetical protein
MGEDPSIGLSASLARAGLRLGRLQTGTPACLLGRVLSIAPDSLRVRRTVLNHLLVHFTPRCWGQPVARSQACQMSAPRGRRTGTISADARQAQREVFLGCDAQQLSQVKQRAPLLTLAVEATQVPYRFIAAAIRERSLLIYIAHETGVFTVLVLSVGVPSISVPSQRRFEIAR